MASKHFEDMAEAGAGKVHVHAKTIVVVVVSQPCHLAHV